MNHDGFEAAFQAALQGGAEGVVILSGPVTVSGQTLLGQLAARYRMPAVSNQRTFAEAGGLITYGPGGEASLRRAATFVDRILKGAKPADLPMEQPTTFECLVNLKSAQALGLTIPQSVLQQATEAIQ